MTEQQKFEIWASSIGCSVVRVGGEYYDHDVEIAWLAWLAAKHQAHCEALSDLHKLEQKVAHGCTDASCKECDE